jgi:hypothetical protein
MAVVNAERPTQRVNQGLLLVVRLLFDLFLWFW